MVTRLSFLYHNNKTLQTTNKIIHYEKNSILSIIDANQRERSS